MSTQHRVIFDTDIGTDVDDILALGVLLGSEEIAIDGITTVYADVDIRTRMVHKVLELAGANNIPVHKGIGTPLLDRDPIYWPGHEGVGLIGDDDTPAAPARQTAIDFLVNHVRENPGEITLLAVGPLTNVAAAMTMDPDFSSSLKRLVIMGGRINTSDSTWGPAEHNIKCDPDAAHIVFSRATNIELIPLDVTLRVLIRQTDVDKLNATGRPLQQAIADQVARYPGFVHRGGDTFLHDPLAAMAVIQPELLTWSPYNIRIELNGTLTRAMTVACPPTGELPANARVAMDLDVNASEHAVIDRLCRQGGTQTLCPK